MNEEKQKKVFFAGAIFIILGIIIAKVGENLIASQVLSVIGILMIAVGAILMSINIIYRFKVNRDEKNKN